MKKYLSLKVFTLVSGLVFLATSSNAIAHYYSYGYSLDVIGYKQQGTDAAYIFGQASNIWNEAADTRIGHGPESNNLATVWEYEDNWLGLYSKGVNSFIIRVNERTIKNLQQNSYPNLTWRQLAINTAVHEFGHALYLADIKEGFGDNSIMSYERDRSNPVPREHDIEDIIEYRDN